MSLVPDHPEVPIVLSGRGAGGRARNGERIFLMACGTLSREAEEVVTAMTASRLRRA